MKELMATLEKTLGVAVDPLFAVSGLVLILAVLVWFLRPKRPYVKEINYYPIKSCGGLKLSVAEFDWLGLKYDRRYLVTAPDGKFITARQYPQMVLIQPSFRRTAQGEPQLVLDAPKMDQLVIPVKADLTQKVKVWKSEMEAGMYQNEEISNWFTTYLGTPARFCKLDERLHNRPIEYEHNIPTNVDEKIQVAFNDGYPVLAISEASIAALQKICPEKISIDNFRPNLVISGCGPFEEDTWKRVRIGQFEFGGVKGCTRCIFTTINPKTGEKSKNGEPLLTLRKMRNVNPVSHEADGQAYMGMNLVHKQTNAKVKVGDVVQVLERHT